MSTQGYIYNERNAGNQRLIYAQMRKGGVEDFFVFFNFFFKRERESFIDTCSS